MESISGKEEPWKHRNGGYLNGRCAKSIPRDLHWNDSLKWNFFPWLLLQEDRRSPYSTYAQQLAQHGTMYNTARAGRSKEPAIIKEKHNRKHDLAASPIFCNEQCREMRKGCWCTNHCHHYSLSERLNRQMIEHLKCGASSLHDGVQEEAAAQRGAILVPSKSSRHLQPCHGGGFDFVCIGERCIFFWLHGTIVFRDRDLVENSWFFHFVHYLKWTKHYFVAYLWYANWKWARFPSFRYYFHEGRVTFKIGNKFLIILLCTGTAWVDLCFLPL